MASLYATALRLPSPMKPNTLGACNLKLASPVALRTAFRMRRSSRLEVCCAAKAETVERVAEIVKKTLALPEGTEVTAGSKFADLGADSLDTVEIVMAIEENFDVSVEEESSQNIATVQDVAELIEELVQKKAAAV